MTERDPNMSQAEARYHIFEIINGASRNIPDRDNRLRTRLNLDLQQFIARRPIENIPGAELDVFVAKMRELGRLKAVVFLEQFATDLNAHPDYDDWSKVDAILLFEAIYGAILWCKLPPDPQAFLTGLQDYCST